ncbi:hypothetical protein CONCODRAFT_80161 [Conidiobolus coronatus NRRL 28638]|uniref:YABBY protein C-terminal domain-containing protein n=1 Tax=Conidiobolus coronatus (strain ATCC 28846 / CBS 209.66 / NRRL 28638) TaxID=796925 RepID=A0A137NXL2_CONC2|nr:hypothetical protein CONCODRAFT_80161 [Conidiobolus coronatus NRRL 28638]|eukprot:KXN67418.1 hypothetical protein CONCODRAFT_80161 [Conidiobolus coronatus NRRL 28638]
MPKAAADKKTTKGAKKLSPYNKFMKEELPKWKAKNPNAPHKDAFKAVAAIWKTSKENPVNQKA